MAPPEVPSAEPSHPEILAAAQATEDPEMAAWVATPESYILRPASIPGLLHHGAWYLIPARLSRPMGFFVVRGPDGAVRVSSQRPDAVLAILRQEPELTASAQLPAAVFDLLRPQAHSLSLVGGEARPLPDGWALSLEVEAPSGRQTWAVVLADSGCSFQVREVP